MSACHAINHILLITGSVDLKIINKNADGLLEDTVDVEKLRSALVKVCDLFYNKPGSFTPEFIDGQP